MENSDSDNDFVCVSPEDCDNDDDEDLFTDEDYYDPRIFTLQSIITTYCAYTYESPAKLEDGSIEVDIPRYFLPLSLQAAYGFLSTDYILHLSITLNDYSWNEKPTSINAQHPLYGQSYVGDTLVKMAIDDFFSPEYKKRENYRSAPYFLSPQGSADQSKLKYLEDLGFSAMQSQRALLLCDNHIERSINFLRTGELPLTSRQFDMSKFPSLNECPLIYLILEVANSFLDIQDHCSICRCPLSPGLRPTICNKDVCNFRLTQIGIGISVIQEIKRDPLAADLVFSIFSSAVKTSYLTPAPTGFPDPLIEKICATLPAMTQLAQSCNSDQDLARAIGDQAMYLLRWVLLSNRSHLIYLPPELQLPDFRSSKQFMALISSPESECAFQALKEKYGSIFLWHGSHGERWHSIVRNGLKNYTGTEMQQNGSAYGEGIYFSKKSEVSWSYSKASENKYRRSKIGKNLHIISLCEIAKLPYGVDVSEKLPFRDENGNLVYKTVRGSLKDFDRAHTLTLEDACVVRFIMVGGDFKVDVLSNPPSIPTLEKVINYQIEHNKKK